MRDGRRGLGGAGGGPDLQPGPTCPELQRGDVPTEALSLSLLRPAAGPQLQSRSGHRSADRSPHRLHNKTLSEELRSAGRDGSGRLNSVSRSGIWSDAGGESSHSSTSFLLVGFSFFIAAKQHLCPGF